MPKDRNEAPSKGNKAAAEPEVRKASCLSCGGFGSHLDPVAPGSKTMELTPCDPCKGRGYVS